MAPRGIPISRDLVDRVAGVVRGAIHGASEAWFGPAQPIGPQAPPDVRGRAFDYATAFNLPITPRSEQGQGGITFATLRALADPALGGFDLLRLAIETRKDQMAAQGWTISARVEDGEQPTDAQRKRAREIALALRKPDLEHTFAVWQRMLLEDLLVVDAPVVYLAPSTLGYRIPRVMDGTLLKRLIAPDGTTPLPPEPAFQQQLKGIAAVSYTLDEVVYGARNLRSDRVYGMSPTEQVISTVNIALRRQLSQLEFYTAGSVPDLLLGVPENWTPEQIKTVQEWFDSILSGNTEERRRARFIPGGVKPFPLKEGALKDQWDEWLARIVCYAFSLSPQALVQQMNRATAETAKEQARDEGLEPLKLWWADFVDEVLAKAFDDGAEYQLAYADEEIGDAATKATVFVALKSAGIVTADEVRAAYGKPPLTPEQREELKPPPAPNPFGAPMGGEDDDDEEPPTPPKSKSREAGEDDDEPEDDADQTEKLAKALVAKMRSDRLFVPARVKPAQLGLFPPEAPKA